MPVARAACSTTAPFGPAAAVGSLHVEFAAQRAVMPTTVRPLPPAKRSVQPLPFPRPSATFTGMATVAPGFIDVGAAATVSFPGVRPSLTTIVPAPAGAA